MFREKYEERVKSLMWFKLILLNEVIFFFSNKASSFSLFFNQQQVLVCACV